MQQYPRRPAQRPAPQRSAQQRPAPRRRMSRAEYERLMKKRRQERMISIALLAAIVIIIIVTVTLILRPKDDPSVPAQTTVQTTASPTPSAEPEPTPEPTAVPAADSAPADSDPAGSDPVPGAPAAVPPVQTTTGGASGDLRSVRFRVTGDIMVTEDQLYYAFYAANQAGFDFMPQFELIADALSNADFTIGNLETTIGMYRNKNYSGYPLFNSPESLLDALKASGYDFFTLANNHMLDRWFDGMKNTVNWVEQYGFEHVGAYRSQEERDTPKIIEINGIKFGFVAYTHSTNTQERVCDEAAQIYGVPYLYRSDIAADVRKLREAGAEVVIALPHWGDEYVRQPDSNQAYYAQKLAAAGVDIILGSHSHMVQPIFTTTYTAADGITRNVFAISSLGNFLSTHTVQYTDWGLILDFTVSELPDGSFTVENVGYIPTYCWIHDGTVQIISAAQYLDNPPAGMTAEAYQRMRASYYECVELLGDGYTVLKG